MSDDDVDDPPPSDTMSSASLAFCAAAETLVGLVETDDRYRALVAPGDTPARQAAVAKESGCELVRLGLEELVTLVAPRGPSVNGTATKLLEERAGGYPWAPAGGWRIPTLESPPKRGEGVFWGACGPHVAHADACVAVVAGDGPERTLTVVAGGQRTPAGLETVRRSDPEDPTFPPRRIEWQAGRAKWVDLGTGREILGCLVPDWYADRYGLR